MIQGGVEYDLSFLRSLSWIESTGAQVGHSIHMELLEMGLDGPAQVVAFERCPEIEPDDGTGRNVVTGPMAHPGDNILYLDITGLDEPLGVTDTHPIWSETRQDFVVAGQLEVGEQFRTLNGESATLTKIHPHRGPPQMVFNLEVDGQHVYSVAGNGLLVHNACPALPLHGRPHGGPAHNSVIDQVLGEVVAEGAEDVRKNQALVDIFGDKLTDLRPDGQWTQDGVRHIMQIVDSNPNTHQTIFQQLIPDAVFHIYQIGNNIPVP